MNEQHRHRLQNVDGLIAILRKKHRHHRHVPGMLRIVLPAHRTCHIRLPLDQLLLVDLTEEIEKCVQFFHFFIHSNPSLV